MDALDILETASGKTGWNTDSMLEIACQYIDNQGDNACFQDFVQGKVIEENGEND